MSTTEHYGAEAAYNDLQASVERQEFNLVAALRISPKKDGDKWCVLWGDDLVSGVAGFGDTPALAVYAFNKAVSKGPDQVSYTRADAIQSDPRVKALAEALRGLLDRDQRNTCQHDETYRGGFLWEICDSCGAKWADDEGGKPEWQDPKQWDQARAALAAIQEATHD